MDERAISALLAAATGGAAPELAQRLLLQVTDTLGLSGDPEREEDDALKAAAALQMLQAAAPRDPLEAMLATQMAAVHEAAMRAMKRAAECSDYPQIEALYARQAGRLMGLFMRQTEALEKRRVRAASREAAARQAKAPQDAKENGRSSPRSSSKAPSPTPLPPGERVTCLGPMEPSPLAGEGGVRRKQNKHNGRHPAIKGTGPPP